MNNPNIRLIDRVIVLSLNLDILGIERNILGMDELRLKIKNYEKISMPLILIIKIGDEELGYAYLHEWFTREMSQPRVEAIVKLLTGKISISEYDLIISKLVDF